MRKRKFSGLVMGLWFLGWSVIYWVLATPEAVAATEMPPYPTPEVASIPSEAGQNYGLIGGAAFLVLIVLVGVLWYHAQNRQARKSNDPSAGH